jgi:hypothetical protein
MTADASCGNQNGMLCQYDYGNHTFVSATASTRPVQHQSDASGGRDRRVELHDAADVEHGLCDQGACAPLPLSALRS